MRFDAEDWDAAVDALKRAGSVAIACHINPDGDAFGSLLAASLGLRKLGKKTFPTWGASPAALPPNYSFLPGGDSIVQPDDVPEVDVFLALDCGAGDRVGIVEARAKAAPILINVDHHPGNDMFGTLNIVVTTASSTAELVARLLQDLEVEFDPAIATDLYVGIVTDTGRFQYSNSSPDTMRLAADLLSIGVDHVRVAQEVFESSPFGYLKLLGTVLERAVLFEDSRFVYSWISLDDLSASRVQIEETDKLVDAVRATEAADVAAMFKQQRDGRWRVSLRSKGPSVGALARARGGGGHELAAGFTADDVKETARSLAADVGTARA